MTAAPRVCSLLPSATEIVCALGLQDCLVGITHECDYPPAAQHLPRVTSSAIDTSSLNAGQIDSAIRSSLADQATIYHLDRDLLESLRPDVVFTQELCDVCAVGPDEVRLVVDSLSYPPDVVSLEPRTLDDVLNSIEQVGRLLGAEDRARALRASLSERLDRVARAVDACDAVRVLTMEWIDPLFVGGHWVPDMVRLAGGRDLLGRSGQPSREAEWSEVEQADPSVVIAMLCGFDRERSMQELRRASFPPAWHGLRAVHEGRVYVTDGSAHFSRPGPRLVDGVEILASILHPSAFPRDLGHSYERLAPASARPGRSSA